jgi:hypothetical protein
MQSEPGQQHLLGATVFAFAPTSYRNR